MMNPYALRTMRRPLMRDPRLLIDWRAGEPFPSGGYTRPSDGLTRGADGVWRPCAPGVPRTTWGTDPVTGLLVPRYLTEPEVRNLWPWHSQMHRGGGQATATPNAGTSPDGSMTAARLTEVAGAAGDRRSYAVLGGESVDGRTFVGGLWLRGEGSDIGRTVGVYMKRLAGGSPNQTPTVQVVLSSAWQRVEVAPFTGGTDNTGVSLVIVRGDGDYADSALVWGGQIVEGRVLTSDVPTDGAPATRDRDTLYIELPDEVARPGTPLAIYVRTLVGVSGRDISGGTSLWGITNHGGAAPRLSLNLHSTTGALQLYHSNGESFTNAATSLAPAAGDLVESLTLIWTEIIDGRRMLVGELHARTLPAGSSQWGPIHAADLPPLEPAPEWSARRLYIGSRGSAPGVYEYEAFRVWSGVWAGSADQMLARARGEA